MAKIIVNSQNKAYVIKSKPYDAEIEYLVSNGNQSIELNWNGNSATDAYYIDYRCTTVQTQARFFHGDSAPVDLYVNGSKYLAYSFNGSNYRATSTGVGTNKRRTYKVDFYNKTYTIDGNTRDTYDDSTGTSANMRLLIVGGKFIGNVYAAKVYKEDVLSIDLIPVRVGNVGYMYDKVRGVLLSNSGTEPFTLGPDVTIIKDMALELLQPVFYQRISFDGKAGIQTDIQLPVNGSICCDRLGDEKVKNIDQYVFTVYGSNTTGACRFLYGGQTSNSYRQFCIFYDSSSIINATRTLSYNYSSYSYFFGPKRQANGNSGQNYTKGSLTHPNGGIMIGNLTNSYTSTVDHGYNGTMEKVYIYDSTAQNAQTFDAIKQFTPVATLRPCLYGSEAGMWYVEGNKFYGNTRSEGTITVDGNIVE